VSGTCYIVANTPPASFGWLTRARGLRADQLAAQARTVFSEVRFVLFLERYDLLRNDRGFAILAPPRDDTVLIAQDSFEAFCDRLAPATFVFTHTEFADKAAYAAGRHTIVYDILSLTELTLQEAGAGEAELRQFRMQHQRMLRLAARTIVNGPKAAQWLAHELKDRDICIAPLAPAPVGPTARRRTHLLFGGAVPRWVDVTPTFRTMAAFLTQNTDVATIMMAPEGQTEDANALEYSALWLMPHVTTVWNLSALNDAEILSICFGFVDWAPLSTERAHSASVRTLLAVAAGVPVLHQSGTTLDALWDPFPGERIDDPVTPDDVARFVARARSGADDDAGASAQKAMQRWRSDPRPFEGLHRCAS